MKIRGSAVICIMGFFILSVIAVHAVAAGAESGIPPILIADLSGKEEVPPVESSAGGRVEFYLSEDGTELRYRLKVSGMSNITAAHIHLGSQGENDRVVVVLFDFTGPYESSISRTEIDGAITAANLVGPLVGNSLSDLLREMGAGHTYLNVHSQQHPQGHIRGHIVQPTAAGSK